MIFQLVFSVAFFAAFLLTWRRVRQGVLRWFEGVLWTGIWAGAVLVLWRPEATNIVANLFGIGRGADFILYSAVILLTFGWFTLALAIDRMERRLTKLVEAQALESFRRDHLRS